MNNKSRFKDILSFKKTDRIPVMEWASWWNKTIERWRSEGLPENVQSSTDIMEYFGLDVHKQFWLSPRGSALPAPPAHGHCIMSSQSIEGYKEIRPLLNNPKDVIKNIKSSLEMWAEKQDKGEVFIWLTLDGFFWYPRKIMGIENHLYAFYDEPELMHMMNEDVLNFNIELFEEFTKICTPDFMTIAEDMSYNNGPMISEELFNEFIAPYYKKMMEVINKKDIPVIVDSDGDITRMIPWFLNVGVSGFLPLERQAGVDISYLREQYPNLKIIGGFDKMVMHLGEKAMREEFERIFPVMQKGGYIPSCDHQTPPSVSLEDYKLYVSLLKEYCQKAMM